MAINLRDIQIAVQDYLNNKVTVTISAPIPAQGAAINPNETFTFKVVVTNANAANGGVSLKNVKYHVSVGNTAIAKIKVPANGTATDLAGNPLVVGAEVREFIFNPTNDDIFNLGVGDDDTLPLSGKAGAGGDGGTTAIQARVLADIDQALLFPRGENTATATKTLSVVG